MSETYYDLLGVASDASREEIERAYRERLKDAHPDVSDDDDAAARTRRLIEARDVLTDEDERGRYDRLGHERYVDANGHGVDSDTRGPGGRGTDSAPSERGDSENRTGVDAGASASGAASAAANASTSGFDAGRRGAGPGESGRRGHREHVGSPGWSHDATDEGQERRTDDADFATRRSDEGLHRSRLFLPGPSLTLLSATFLTYPILLWGALFPPFPLVLNLVVGACVLVVVAYLQSLPEVGVVVFGAWSLLAPAGFLALGVPLVSLAGAVAVLGTVLPLGLSVLTRAVMR